MTLMTTHLLTHQAHFYTNERKHSKELDGIGEVQTKQVRYIERKRGAQKESEYKFCALVEFVVCVCVWQSV